MRVFLGLKEIAGFYGNLERGLREIGVDAEYFDLSSHPFRYGEGMPRRRFVRLAQLVSRKRNATPRARLAAKLWWALLDQALRLPLLLWALWHFDVFIFGYKSSFVPGLYDLPLLRLFRKRIIYTFHGSDARPPYIDGSDMAPLRGLSVRDCIRLAARKKRELRRIERYAHVLISHPPYAHFHERPFVTSLTMGNPVRPLREAAVPGNEAVRILHSPSNPEAKGTARVRRAVERLRAGGHELEYVEITGQPNEVVLRELERCDLVVDQLYSDAPLASFATEASFMGRPAVIGGYVTPADLGVPADRIPPCELCHPDEVEARIEKLIADPEYRREAGLRTRRFVVENWSPERVAENFLRVIRGDIPDDWWFDPHQIRYLQGCCLPEERGRELVREVVREGGVEALQLGDKPDLERRLLEWAEESKEECCSDS